MTSDLETLGDAIQRAAADDLRDRDAAAERAAAPRRRRRRVVIGVVAAALAVPAIGLGISRLVVDEESVAASLPAGTLALAGTEPTCEVVREDVEFLCTLTRPPAPEVADWKGTVEPTVGADSRVNGGCRSLDSAGLTWRCYLGEEAVRQQIIGPDFLGEISHGPGVG